MKHIINMLHEPKSKLGFTHGVLTLLGSFFLAFLTMMLFSKFMVGDYAFKIMPSVILTPILISLYAIWLLFSLTLLRCILKISLLASLLIVMIKVF